MSAQGSSAIPTPASRVVILGLDGGTWSLLGPAFERGWMPNLARWWREARTGTVRSSRPMVTPVAWTSFLTGCTPDRHGIREFYYISSDEPVIHPNHAGRIRVPTLWDELDSHGLEVVSLALPMTYPAPAVRGLVVGGADAPGLDAAFAQCPDFGRRVRAEVPGFTTKICFKRRPRSDEEALEVGTRCVAAFDAQARVAELADAEVDWSALLVHFHNLDGLLHRMWPELDLDDTGPGRAEWQAPALACLVALDRSIGRLLELADRRSAAVVVVSDHGFGPCRAIVNTNGILERMGHFRGLNFGTRFRYRWSRCADRLARWAERRKSGGPAKRAVRSVSGEVSCNWRHTRAFSPFGQLNAPIYLTDDLLGNASARERVVGEIAECLSSLQDPATGRPLFGEVVTSPEPVVLDHWSEPQRVADLVAHSANGFQAQAKWSVFDSSWIRPDPNLPATHYWEGVLGYSGPGLEPGTGLDAELHDVAPTILRLLDLPVPETMEGRVLELEPTVSDELAIPTIMAPERPTRPDAAHPPGYPGPIRRSTEWNR